MSYYRDKQNLKFMLGERRKYRKKAGFPDNIYLELIKGCADSTVRCDERCDHYPVCMNTYYMKHSIK